MASSGMRICAIIKPLCFCRFTSNSVQSKLKTWTRVSNNQTPALFYYTNICLPTIHCRGFSRIYKKILSCMRFRSKLLIWLRWSQYDSQNACTLRFWAIFLFVQIVLSPENIWPNTLLTNAYLNSTMASKRRHIMIVRKWYGNRNSNIMEKHVCTFLM